MEATVFFPEVAFLLGLDPSVGLEEEEEPAPAALAHAEAVAAAKGRLSELAARDAGVQSFLASLPRVEAHMLRAGERAAAGLCRGLYPAGAADAERRCAAVQELLELFFLLTVGLQWRGEWLLPSVRGDRGTNPRTCALCPLPRMRPLSRASPLRGRISCAGRCLGWSSTRTWAAGTGPLGLAISGRSAAIGHCAGVPRRRALGIS